MANSDRPVVQIIGDGAAGQWLTWRWANGTTGIHRARGLGAALSRFQAALPTSPSAPNHSLSPRQQELRTLTELGLYGPLTRGDDERHLMQALADALLSEALRHQILNAPGRVQVRVMPSPPAASVPWGLLPIDGERRLLEVADVSWIGPILPRDLAMAAPPRHDDQGQPLFVCNPGGTRVMKGGWESCGCFGHQDAVWRHGGITRDQLRDDLERGASRLLVVGHCTSGLGGDTGIQLQAGKLLASHLIHHPDTWHMPPRVGVVACASGTDLVQLEPFGLATGLLVSGAETAQLTLWTLPTDEALARVTPTARGGFALLAQAVDHAQASPDPVAALNQFQRQQLAEWRANPGVKTSPLMWGAVFTMTAPHARRVVLETTDATA